MTNEELDTITIETIVEDIFTTLSTKKRKKDIVQFYINKAGLSTELFAAENLTKSPVTVTMITRKIENLLKQDQKQGQNSFLKLTKSFYSKRPKHNPNINPTESLYTGKAGECAVMSELLFYGYNVNSMMVDEGVDLVASKDNVYYYIQVKTTNITEKNRAYFKIKSQKFDGFLGTQIRYFLVARCKIKNEERNIFFLFNNGDIARLSSQQKINESSDCLNIKIEFDDRTGRAFIYDRNREDIDFYMNNFNL